jgi:RNA polymerase sigma-70 factor, ECF subfamily
MPPEHTRPDATPVATAAEHPVADAGAASAGRAADGRPAGGPTDEQLMVAFTGGDASAFEQLVARHQRGVYNFLLRSAGNRARAEELLQEVFLRVVRSRARYEAAAKFSTWLYSIARNLSIDESRRARFRGHQSLDAPRRGADGQGASMLSQLPADGVPTDEAAEAPSIRRRLAEAVQTLPEEQREVFLLRQLSGLSFREIADTVGIPENTVKSRMRYALEKLRAELGDLRRVEPTRGRRHV